jgi:cyclohexa-1,5-dienecarbonyl-CoA hydratase
MMEELAQALAEIEAHSEISAVVLSGEGRAFSAGVDVAAHTPDQVERMLTKFHAVVRALVAARKVTIAAVQGIAWEAARNWRWFAIWYTPPRRRSGDFPRSSWACYPPVACTALAALVGQKAGAELILTGRTISGTEAGAMGLATRAVPDEEAWIPR